MREYKAAIIGCGRPWRSEGSTGFGMGHQHARGYEECAQTSIVAISDIKAENAEAFREDHGGTIYLDYKEMLAKEKPDFVSICVWTGLHAQIVIDCANAGTPVIFCEKPMAPTWAEAKSMAEAARNSGSILAFCHQRRFEAPFMKAREFIRSGRIGELKHIFMTTDNLFDWGTHWFDMMFYYNGESPAKWVLGQVEATGGAPIFGIRVEGQGVSNVEFENGVQAVMLTNRQRQDIAHRLVGTDGIVEIGATGWDTLRVWSRGQTDWEEIDTKEPEGAMSAFGRAVTDLVKGLETGTDPELGLANAMRATELIFATYESSNRKGRIDLPLDAEDVAIRATEDGG